MENLESTICFIMIWDQVFEIIRVMKAKGPQKYLNIRECLPIIFINMGLIKKGLSFRTITVDTQVRRFFD